MKRDLPTPVKMPQRLVEQPDGSFAAAAVEAQRAQVVHLELRLRPDAVSGRALAWVYDEESPEPQFAPGTANTPAAKAALHAWRDQAGTWSHHEKHGVDLAGVPDAVLLPLIDWVCGQLSAGKSQRLDSSAEQRRTT